MKRPKKVTIVGGGIMGLATAWGLQKRGHAVTLLEQGELPNPMGSSVDQHRLIRYPYGAQPGFTKMVAQAYEQWDLLFADVGERPYQETGSLVLAVGSDKWARDSADCLSSLGHRPRWLTPSELEKSFPLIRADGIKSAFSVDSGGVLLASKIVAALARYLKEKATLLTQTKATSVDLDTAKVTLANGATLESDVVVVTAGAWAQRIVPELAKFATPSRQIVTYLEPPDDLKLLWDKAPLLLDIDQDQGFYLVPPVLGTGLKVGDHRFTLKGDPDKDRRATDEEARAVAELCRPRLRDFDRYKVAGAKTCFYTVEPQERFLVLPRGKGLIVSACSGHAFKFGSVVGARVAETIDEKRDAGELALWAAGELTD